MASLNQYLPPYSSDFTGVLSVLFDLGGLVIIHDAACCTKCYTDYEEPRWNRERNSTFCSQLRTVDAILGNDDKLINLAIDAAKEIKPPFIAILGTPVPSIIGTDMNGIASEIENATGIKSIGFSTDGFSSYDKGIEMAISSLISAFAKPKKQERTSNKIRLNLIGLTPLDFYANENQDDIKIFFENEGFEVKCTFGMDYDIKSIEDFFNADVNLALTTPALRVCEKLYKKYSIPYVCGSTIGTAFSKRLSEALYLSSKTKIPILAFKGETEMVSKDRKDKILIVWEQTMAKSLKKSLQQLGCRDKIITASFGNFKSDVADEEDIFLKSEEQLIYLLKNGGFKKVIADKLILDLPQIPAATSKFEICHPALSSNLYPNSSVCFLSKEFDDFIEQIIK